MAWVKARRLLKGLKLRSRGGWFFWVMGSGLDRPG